MSSCRGCLFWQSAVGTQVLFDERFDEFERDLKHPKWHGMNNNHKTSRHVSLCFNFIGVYWRILAYPVCVCVCVIVCVLFNVFWPSGGFKSSAMVCQKLELVVVVPQLHRSRMALQAALAARATLALRQRGFPRASAASMMETSRCDRCEMCPEKHQRCRILQHLI
jgi:hypothetical protein